MRTTFLFSISIVISLALVIFPGVGLLIGQTQIPVTATTNIDYQWVLVDTKITPETLPIQGTFDNGVKVEATITAGSAEVRYSTAEWTSTFLLNLDTPPARLNPGETLRLKVTGKVTTNREKGFPLRVSFTLPGAREIRLIDPHEPALNTTAEVAVSNPRRPVRDEDRLSYRLAFRVSFHAPTGVSGDMAVDWIYRPSDLLEPKQPEPEATPQPETSAPVKTQPAVSPQPVESLPETSRERMERAIAQNLVDYIDMYRKFEKELQPLCSRADSIMEGIRDAQWFLAHGTDEDKKQARADIARLQREMKSLLEEFNSRASRLEGVLTNIEAQFVQYEQKHELVETLKGFRSQMNLTRINLVLRSGNVEEFDALFRQYREDPIIADQVLVGNAFRRLMAGDTRTALESVKLALDKNEDNPTAQQLLRDLELHYLDIIRDKIAGEESVNASLFNAKLNGHGQEGVGGFLVDVLTTGVGESFQALAGYMEIYLEKGAQGLGEAGYQAVSKGQHPKGYYDFLQEISSLNIDEATAQIAGIQFVKTLRQHGITLNEMSEMTVPRLQEIVLDKFNGRVISEAQATILRKRIWDAFKNPDVDTLRKGQRTQLDVDIGRDYFDAEVLQVGMSDTIMKQFSAWDTFLTFAPSAQLGSISKLGVAQRLGLKAETTLQQALQKGLMIEELGQRLYQTKAGAAVIDATYQWNGFTEMVSQAVKNRVGEVAYAAGSTAIQTALNQMSAPVKEALKKELLEISDYYLGADKTATVEATVDTLSNFFGFIGLNSEALQRGAYGVADLEKANAQIQAELTQRQALANNPGIAQASSRPAHFNDFEKRVTSGGDAYLRDLSDARDRIKGAAGSLSDRRGSIVTQGDKTLQQMEEAAQALRRGDRTRAQHIFESMQSGAGRNFDFVNQENLRKLGGATDTMRRINALGSKSPTDRDFASEVTKVAMSFTSEAHSGAVGEFKDLTNALIAAGLRVIPG